MVDQHCLTTYIASKILVKGKLKVILILLFGCSLFFLSYQFINYSNLTSYQSDEFHKRLGGNQEGSGGGLGFATRSRKGSNGYHSLKDIALKFEIEKQNHKLGPEEILVVPSKGDTGPLVVESKFHKKGKPIFSEHLLGVAPESQKYYRKQSHRSKDFFSCRTSGKQITWDKVNDDFCDCPSDGSDEPSTAACMNGSFFCSIVKLGYPQYVPSSMVNDGICDCADGSDEHLRMNSISCKNRS